MMYHLGAVCLAFVIMSMPVQGAQSDKKLSDSLCRVLEKPDSSIGKKSVPEQYFTCIDNLEIVPTVLAELIAQYASGKRKFSHDKVIFQEEHRQVASAILLNSCCIATRLFLDVRIKIWDCERAIYLRSLCGHGDFVTALAALPDPYDSLASGSRNGTIKIWNFMTGMCQRTLDGHSKAITALAALPSGYMVSAGVDSVIIWNFKTGGLLKRLRRSKHPVLTLMPIGNNRVDEVSSKNISELVINNGRFVRHIHYHTETRDIRAATLADGNILIATDEPCLKILGSGHGELIASITLKHRPKCLAYHEENAFIGHMNGSVTVIHIPTKSCMQELHAHDHIDTRDYSISNILPLNNGSILVSCLRGCMHSFKVTEDLVDGA